MAVLLEMGLSNAAQVTVLAGVVALLVRGIRNVAVRRWLWVLVLLKLVTPPVVDLPLVSLPPAWSIADDTRRSGRGATRAATRRLAQGGVGIPTSGVAGSRAGEMLPADGARAPAASEPDGQGGNAAPTVADPTAAATRSTRFRGQSAPVPIPSRIARRAVSTAGDPWMLAVAGVWVAGSLVWFGTLTFCSVRFERFLRRARRAPQRLQQTAQRLAGRMGLRCAPEVLVVEARMSPFLWGRGSRGTIVLPAELIGRLAPAQQSVILAHELTHLARHRRWLTCLEIGAVGLYWWHPVAWIARQELRNCEELCCDSVAISVFSLSPREYARTLLDTACFLADGGRPIPRIASGFGEPNALKRRIKMIVKSQLRHQLSWGTRLGVVLAGLAVLPFSPITFGGDDEVAPATVTPPAAAAAGAASSLEAALQEPGSQERANDRPPGVVEPSGSRVSRAALYRWAGLREPLAPRQSFENPGELVIDNGFEDSEAIAKGVPSQAGSWSGDASALVGSDQGIIPKTGKRMLRFLGSGPNGGGKVYTGSEVMQLFDLSEYRDQLAAGTVNLTASVHVNRVHHSEKTDTAFNLAIHACAGSMGSFYRRLVTDDTLGEATGSVYADKDPETWERILLTMRLPRDTVYVGIRLTAGENISDDADNEFDGHYADDVSVQIHPRARAAVSRSVHYEGFRKLFKAESKRQ